MNARLEARRAQLILAVASFLVLAVLGFMVARGYGALDSLDREIGTAPQRFAYDNPWLIDVLLVIQTAFGTRALTILTVLTAAALWSRGHPRAAVWTVAVMLLTGLSTTLLKNFFDRARPEWENPLETLSSYSFPSGHASGTAAAAGVAITLALMLIRRRTLRQLVTVTALVLVVVVGADRIFLGVHNLSDILAGWALGAVCVLLGLLVYSPAPRSIALTSEALPEVYPKRERQVAVILNPVKVEDVDEFQRQVSRAAEEGGWAEPTWHFTTVEDPGISMAEEAAVSGADMVLVCGGDGTVRTVCAELAGTGIPVGIVPAGTGNLLARNLGIPLYLPSAIDVALHGQDRAIDLVRVEGDGIPPDSHFLVMAGMGFDAMIMEGVNEQFKAKVGWLAYVWAGLRSLMFPATRLDISVDGGPFTRHRARTIVIGNVGYLQAGMPLMPHAEIDDGHLDVVLINPSRFLSWLRVAARVLSRGQRVDEMVNRMTCRSIVVRAAHDTPRQLDGDSIGPGRELRAECLHGRLLVRVPR